MEKIAVKVSCLQKGTAGLAVTAVLAEVSPSYRRSTQTIESKKRSPAPPKSSQPTKTIRAGDEISASDLAFVSVPNSTVADGAITKKDIDDSSKTPRRSRRNPVHHQGLPAHQRIDCR